MTHLRGLNKFLAILMGELRIDVRLQLDMAASVNQAIHLAGDTKSCRLARIRTTSVGRGDMVRIEVGKSVGIIRDSSGVHIFCNYRDAVVFEAGGGVTTDTIFQIMPSLLVKT